MKRQIVFLFLLIGCAKKVFYNPNKTTSEAQKDFLESKYEATKSSYMSSSGYNTAVGAGLADGLKYVEVMNACMEMKGYTLITEKELYKQKKLKESQTATISPLKNPSQ
ncbi:MAG: hypothetical protein HZA78_09175 [Candidatus Schekmanbacteria bacterium]|nr:hypothetical protein [Candidatus Schekmanbacteria bacterium]